MEPLLLLQTGAVLALFPFAGSPGEYISVGMAASSAVVDAEVEPLEGLDPASYLSFFEGQEPLEGCMVSPELELAPAQVGTEMLDAPDHSQQFSMGHAVVAFGLPQ